MAYNEKARIKQIETLRKKKELGWKNTKLSETLKKKKESGYVFFPGGGIHTEEARKKYRETVKKKYANGYINPMQGKHLSEEAKKKVAESSKKRKGKPHPWAKGKPTWSKGTKGLVKSWNKGKHGLQIAWNKGLRSRTLKNSEELSRLRNSIEYLLWRESVYIRDNYTCVICGKKGGILNAHHIAPFSQFPELRFAINNGITVCKTPCHKILHKKVKRLTWVDNRHDDCGVEMGPVNSCAPLHG